MNEYGRIERLALRHARTAFRDQPRLDDCCPGLNYHAIPDFPQALSDYDRFAGCFSAADILWLEDDPALTPDAIYVRDAAIPSPRGMILCNMGKPERRAEPGLHGAAFRRAGICVLGEITGEGYLEGGDFIWLDARTCAVAEGYRTNPEGIRQLRDLLGSDVHVEVVPLPHYKGPADVFHLMSVISPLDHDLALVHSPLMPVRFRNWLLSRGMTLVEVDPGEFETLGCNVLALGPRHLLMAEGCDRTADRLRSAGCRVETYPAEEISRKGEGGPTCLTRPFQRQG
ncbi:amidinotransferase [Alphaproteobacteria bacterium HT1-32]|nr:amidinotransferase [Alphaproteobacteria bacterium HT1-32]